MHYYGTSYNFIVQIDVEVFVSTDRQEEFGNVVRVKS